LADVKPSKEEDEEFMMNKEKMMKKLLILALILAVSSAAQAATIIFEDNFDSAWGDNGYIDYRGWDHYAGAKYDIGGWSGFHSYPAAGGNPDKEGDKATLLAYNFIDTFNYGMGQTEPPEPESYNGVLRMASINSHWADNANTGPFLYYETDGDFSAEVEVVSIDYWWHSLGGLMARKPNQTPDVEGTENWVYLTHFPVWNVGNHIRNTTNGSSSEAGIKNYPPDAYLRLTRIGTTFYFETSADGVTYTSLPGLEAGVDRPDMAGVVEVGIYQCTYSDLAGTMDFDNFSLVVPEPTTVALLGFGALALIRRKR
jgi:regulation of enolase protein 1 (concanavalin A-like superfamily)